MRATADSPFSICTFACVMRQTTNMHAVRPISQKASTGKLCEKYGEMELLI